MIFPAQSQAREKKGAIPIHIIRSKLARGQDDLCPTPTTSAVKHPTKSTRPLKLFNKLNKPFLPTLCRLHISRQGLRQGLLGNLDPSPFANCNAHSAAQPRKTHRMEESSHGFMVSTGTQKGGAQSYLNPPLSYIVALQRASRVFCP